MRCVQCETRNPVGNKFCRECGGKLSIPENDLVAEEAARAEAERNQERAARLLTDAFLFSDQNKIEQAILLAQEAAELMPRSTSAHALLVSLYERSGQREKAIASQERIVELNPLSTVDADNLQRLRSGRGPIMARDPLSSSAAAALATAKRNNASSASGVLLPIVAAAAAGAIVLGIGLSTINRQAANQRRAARNAAQNATPPIPAVASPEAVAAAPTGAITLGGTGGAKVDLPPPTSGSADPFAAGGSAPATPKPTPSTGGAPLSIASTNILSLPHPKGGNDRGFSLPPAPVRLIGVPSGSASTQDTTSGADANQQTASAQSGGGNAFGSGGRLTVAAPPAGDTTSGAAPAPQEPTPTPTPRGYIHITVHSARSIPDDNSVQIAAKAPQDSTSGQSYDDPLLKAQSLQRTGHYREAIGAYQSAISSSPASAGAAYQGIALSHQRLGDNNAARAAYQQAISAYEAQAAAGRDTGAAKRGIDTCKAALEVLGG